MQKGTTPVPHSMIKIGHVKLVHAMIGYHAGNALVLQQTSAHLLQAVLACAFQRRDIH
jgi:hypothetical protein